MHLLNGSWLANIEKSTRHVNHQFASATMTFTISGTDVRFSYEGINASGKAEKSEQSLIADGEPHPHPLAPEITVMNSLARRDFQTTATKGGAVMGHGSYAVSEDGNTMTATVRGVNGSGKTFEQVIVFDRKA